MRIGLKQIIGIVFLSLAIAVTQIPASFVEAVSNNSEYEKDGNSIISYTGTAPAVSVPNGITIVCTEAFSNNQSMKSLSIPGSVSKIENGAFRGCTNLEQVTMGNGLETLESGAFSMCPNLTSVTFSKNLYELGAGVFSGDSKLQTVDLNKNPNFVFQDGAIYNKDKTKLYAVLSGRLADQFIMPDSVKEVERYAFWGCNNLKSVSLSSNLETIPEYAFSNCKNLSEVNIPFSVRNIAAKAFEDCTSLRNISIPASVSNIHPTAFDGCKQVKIIAQEGTSAYEFAKELESSVSAKLEQDSTKENSIGSLYNEKPVVPQTNSGSNDEKKETKRVFDSSNPADVSNANVSEYYANDSDDLYGKTRVVNNQAVILMDVPKENAKNESEDKDVIVYDLLVKDNPEHQIGFKTFYQDDTLNNVDVEGGITKLNDLCFARSSIKAVRLPEGTKSIGYGAFYHCDLLSDVEIPSSVTDIAPEAFEFTPFLSNWKKNSSDTFLIVGDGVLLAYKGDASAIRIPEQVKKIAGGAFKNHEELTMVELNDSLYEIGEDAFAGCTSLSKISGADRLEKISDRAFYNCPLSQLHIPANVTQIGLGAFSGNNANSVVFLGSSILPNVSYEDSATLLENEQYRNAPFGNVNVAVISGKNTSFEATVFNENLLGFKGLTVSILSDTQKTAKIEYCTLEADPISGSITIPETVQIDGDSYRISQIAPNAFNAYHNINDWSEMKLKNLTIPASLGTIDDYDPSLGLSFDIDSYSENLEDNAQSATEASNESDNNQADEQEQPVYIVTINQSSNSLLDGILANSLDDTTKYQLYVKDAADDTKLKSALELTYGNMISGQLQSFDLQLIDDKSKVAISQFGDRQIELWIPVSDTLYSQEICAVTLKESGDLQTIYGHKEKKDDTSYFVFRTNHFSVYGIYAGIGDTAEIIKLESKKLLAKDDSPETGENVNPKWFLALGLLFAGIFVLFSKKRNV